MCTWTANLRGRFAFVSRGDCHLRWPDQDAPLVLHCLPNWFSIGNCERREPLSPADMHGLCARFSFPLSNPVLQHSSHLCRLLTLLAALLQQHSSPFDFPISSESKYIHDRPFSNPSFPTNDFPYSRGRSQSTLTSGASGPGVALPTNSSLEFNNNSLLNDTP